MLGEQVLVRAKANVCDPDFFKRWRVIGPIFTGNGGNAKKISVIVVDFYTIVDNAFLKRYPNVRYICSATTGHTHLTADFERRKIKLITLRGETDFLRDIRSVSEFVLEKILSIYCYSGSMRKTLNGKMIGIIGSSGRIGTHIRKSLSALGCGLYLYDKHFTINDMHRLLTESDIVTLHLPESPLTCNFMSGFRLNYMARYLDNNKPWLINTSRPSIVDHNALKPLLNNGSIGGYIHDFEGDIQWNGDEPKNVFGFHHIAGNTLEDRIATDTFIRDKLISEMQKDGVKFQQLD